MEYEVTIKKEGKRIETAISIYRNMDSVVLLLLALTKNFPNTKYDYVIRAIESTRA